ncbi:MAG: translation initiation factor IF-3 [Alphaproteobacteria bacterium]|nr:translation initiation factor IF-3 [Alphaproteobacteria bacterium]
MAVNPDRDKFDKKNSKDTTRINEAIKVPKVRLIDENGDMIGVLSTKEALEKAFEEGLDLVEVNPEGNPPVCKILDYHKYKYTLQKSKKKQKVVPLKELYIHLNIAKGDYDVKLNQLKKFLEANSKVKIAVKIRGREMSYANKALELLNKFYEDIGKEEGAKLDVAPKVEGNNVVTIFSPLKS